MMEKRRGRTREIWGERERKGGEYRGRSREEKKRRMKEQCVEREKGGERRKSKKIMKTKIKMKWGER